MTILQYRVEYRRKVGRMSDAFEQQDWVKFGVAATLSRQYAADQRQFLEQLSHMLEHALAEETQVERKGGFFSKKTICRVTVQLGGSRYVLEDPGRGPLLAKRIQIVRGIALKTEEIAVEVWLAELGAALEERARSSSSARDALANLVG